MSALDLLADDHRGLFIGGTWRDADSGERFEVRAANVVNATFDSIIPGLAAVLVGDDQASRIYVGQKHKASADVGIRSEQVDLPAYVTEHELLATIRRLNRDPEIHGIIVQFPQEARLPIVMTSIRDCGVQHRLGGDVRHSLHRIDNWRTERSERRELAFTVPGIA